MSDRHAKVCHRVILAEMSGKTAIYYEIEAYLNEPCYVLLVHETLCELVK